jgi:hypothetical protein
VEDLVGGAAGDRRVTIRVLGIVQIVLGALCSVAAVAGAVEDLPALLGVLVYAAPAVNLLTTGIGSVRIAPWARRATLISAFVWLALIGIAGGIVLLRFRRAPGMAYEVVLLQVFLSLALALAIALIVFYTRPSVRATFEARQGS